MDCVIGPKDWKQSLPRIYIHLISRKGNLHLPWEHCQTSKRARRHKVSSNMWNNRCRWEATRDCIYKNCRKALWDRPWRNGHSFWRHDEEESLNACSSDVRWPRRQLVPSLLSSCTEAWSLHSKRLRRHIGVFSWEMEGGKFDWTVRRGAEGSGLCVRIACKN